MLQLQGFGPRDLDVLSQPLLVAVELRARREGTVGDHGEDGPLDAKAQPAAPGERPDDGLDAHPLPQGIQDELVAEGPRVDEPDPRHISSQFLRRTPTQDAARQLPQALDDLGVIHPPEVVDDAGLGSLALLVPDALGQLVVLYVTTTPELLTRRSKEHVSSNKLPNPRPSSAASQSMY